MVWAGHLSTTRSKRCHIIQRVLQGSLFFWVGFGLVVWGWTIIGFCVETYGFFLLFSGFFPTALSFLRRVPFLGKILDAPGIKNVRFRGVAHRMWALRIRIRTKLSHRVTTLRCLGVMWIQVFCVHFFGEGAGCAMNKGCALPGGVYAVHCATPLPISGHTIISPHGLRLLIAHFALNLSLSSRYKCWALLDAAYLLRAGLLRALSAGLAAIDAVSICLERF